jgi:hypothetical protein
MHNVKMVYAILISLLSGCFAFDMLYIFKGFVMLIIDDTKYLLSPK